MPAREWTFITNHGAVLALIAQHGQITAREIASILDLTERPVRRIIADLDEAGYIDKTRVGRVNHYRVNAELPLRLAAGQDIAIGGLLEVLQFQGPTQRVKPPRGDRT